MVQVARKKVGTAQHGTGPQETAAWLVARGLYATVTPWRVSIGLDTKLPEPSQLQLVIERTEWSLRFSHDSKMSWLRVTNVPTVQERDDFQLIDQLPPLRNIGKLVLSLEDRFLIDFRRQHATIHTNLKHAEQKLLLWVIASL